MAEGPDLIRLAVFGQPVAHSLSPRIHAQFARQCGLAVDYRAIEATADTFYERVRELAGQGGRGCNVTVPFKNAAWRLARRRSERSDLAEAANTLCFDADGWFADNTDGGGLLFDLEIGAGRSLEGARICLLGAGGAAAGVTAALLQARPSLLLIANRSASRAAALAETLDEDLRVKAVKHFCRPANRRQPSLRTGSRLGPGAGERASRGVADPRHEPDLGIVHGFESLDREQPVARDALGNR